MSTARVGDKKGDATCAVFDGHTHLAAAVDCFATTDCSF